MIANRSSFHRFTAVICAVTTFALTCVPVSVFFNGFANLARVGGTRLAAAPAPVPDDEAPNPQVALYEQERRLVFLPLENDTRDSSLDYLSSGLIKILGGKVESIGYVRAERPAHLLFVRPRAAVDSNSARQAEAEAARAGQKLQKDQDLRVDRYSRAADGSPAPEELQRVLLKVDVRQLDEETYEVVRLADEAAKAAALKADYLVSGSYFYAPGSGLSRESGVTRRGPVTVRLKLYDAVSGRTTALQFKSVIQTIYRELDAPAEGIRDFVAGGGTAAVQVETALAGAMVYLDNLYLGRSPVQGRALPGSYELRVVQEGYQDFRRRVVIDAGRNNSFRVRSPKNDYRARLKITTDPDGAEVYLNLERIGTTSLQRDDLPPGAHRLRLSKAGHVDRFIGVQLSNEDEIVLNESLKPGDTETHFKDPNYVIFDWDHLDVAYYSFLGGLGFYAGYVHFEIRANRIQDRLRAQLPLLSILSLPTLISQGGSAGLLYQSQLIQSNDRRVAQQRRNANISAGIGIVTVLIGAGFLIRGIMLDTAKETGEISWFLRDAVSGGDPSGASRFSSADAFVSGDGTGDSGLQRSAEIRSEAYYEAGLSLSF